jgi:periplasmic divalent cation tolerance protein
MVEAPSLSRWRLEAFAMQFIDVLITCPDRSSADAIARSLVEARLAACVNIGAGVASVYRWKGAIEEAEEVPLQAKTRAALFERLTAHVKAMHPYDVPCIVATEFVAIAPDYAAWLEAETS